MKIQNYVLLLSLLCFSCTEKRTASNYQEGDISAYYDPAKKPFYHGVASGDPLPNGVIIWTRLTPDQKVSSMPVKWIVAEDEAMTKVIKEGLATAYAERDYVIKLDVAGLEPDEYYYYQFIQTGNKSVVGRTKTAPKRSADKVKLAVISCTNYEAGYYNALATLAKQDSMDAIIHLGDYIYEYPPDGYGNPDLDRKHIPAKELISLSDYRTRYAQYRLDKDFQEVHRLHPFISIWDDHEIANNAYKTGAKNHQKDEGDYIQRRQAAQQAYYEWLPIRENAGGQLYRKISMGKLADILLLDERVIGRSAPVENAKDKHYKDEKRSILGDQQLQWLKKSLSSSEARWKIIGNQVIFSDFDYSAVRPDKPKNMDAWDGYPAEKKKIVQFIKEHQIENLIFVSGDTHCSWAFEVPSSAEAYKRNAEQETIAIELGTPSITSSNYDENESLSKVKKIEAIYKKTNPQLKYVNLRDHGYLLLEITKENALAKFHYIETIEKPNQQERIEGQMEVSFGEKKLKLLEQSN